MLIDVRNLSKTYVNDEVETPVLYDLSFSIPQGEFVAIMGPSGSGKSTLMHILGFLDRPTTGVYAFLGEDTAQFSDTDLAALRNKKIGFVFQSFNLLPRTKVLENVILPLEYTNRRDKIEASQNALRAVGLEHRLGHYSNQLSGGEKQRVAIARAIANRPAVLLADEPTANLDTGHGAETMRLLRRLTKEEGATAVIVSHDDRLREIADRVLWLEDGRFKALQALVRDPVCGMLLEPERAAARLDRDGEELFFCSSGCRQEFVDVYTPVGYSSDETGG